ncbi:MAG: hypothetical protein RLZZ139_2230 [Cyanobacteriota bacterium]|jgi:hypothetical protein
MLRRTKIVIMLLCHLKTDVTWNSDDESLVASTTGQPRGHCPYSNNLDFRRGCAPVPALDLDDRRNSIHVTSVKRGFGDQIPTYL